MSRLCCTACAVLGLFLVLSLAQCMAAEDAARVAFKTGKDSLLIQVDGKPFATYVYKDEQISRPYLAHVHVPGGPQVTRRHPPIQGQDAVDHATMHPGIWLSFGDVNRCDYWRNKAKVLHAEFVEQPHIKDRIGRFCVRNEYRTTDGGAAICMETTRFEIHPCPQGILLIWDTELKSENHDITFGDQEEMGLGFRPSTAITVKNGGRIITSSGNRDEKQVRGKTAAWCDYSGCVDGKVVGVTLMPDPKNFRPSWYHARDYGLLVANPFGRKALTKGPVGDVVVKKRESLRLRFGVFVHSSPIDNPADLKAAYKYYEDILINAEK